MREMAMNQGKLNILVVDDEKNIRALFRDELEDEGYEVITAGGGQEALKKSAKNTRTWSSSTFEWKT